jgi:hypothetical protein
MSDIRDVDVYVKVSIASFLGLNHSSNGISCRVGRWRIIQSVAGKTGNGGWTGERDNEQHFRPSGWV